MRLANEILVSEDQLRERVRGIAAAIAADTPDGATLSVLALMDGAFMFCADLVRHLPMPVVLAFPAVQSVDRGGDPGKIALPLDFPVEDAHVVVVEDILDTGRTLSALREHLTRRRPRSLRIAVLLDKPSRRAVPLRPDYVGFRVPNRWIVGYGLDMDGLYRNLPYITYLEPVR